MRTIATPDAWNRPGPLNRVNRKTNNCAREADMAPNLASRRTEVEPADRGHAENVDWRRTAAENQGGQRQGADAHAMLVERVLHGIGEQHLPCPRTLAQARGDVHRVADDRVVHVAGRANVARDHFADIDADAEAGID